MKRRLNPRPRRAFVLLEVLVSLMILGIAVAAIMRSFTQSLGAVRLMTVQTQAQFFAMQLMNEIEISPPYEGSSQGNFGQEFKAYTYRIDVKYEAPYYPLEGVKDVQRFIPLRRVVITIYYNDGIHKSSVPLNMETAIIGFEKMSQMTKQSYRYF